MFNGVEYVREICKQRKIPVSTLEKECGFANGYLNPKKMTKISYDRAQIIAEYLDLDAHYIATGEYADSKEIILTPKDERDIKKDLENIMEKLRNGDDGPANFDGEEIPEDDRELFAGQVELMLRRLKAINKEKSNPNKRKE